MKELRGALHPMPALERLFFANKRVKQLFFLNQFNLKSIYDQLVREDPSNLELIAAQSRD